MNRLFELADNDKYWRNIPAEATAMRRRDYPQYAATVVLFPMETRACSIYRCSDANGKPRFVIHVPDTNTMGALAQAFDRIHEWPTWRTEWAFPLAELDKEATP